MLKSCVEVPEKLLTKPDFEKSQVFTPIGKWKNGVKVSYTISFKSDDNACSEVMKWSDPFTVTDKANPFLLIPTDWRRRNRFIYRKFDNNEPELIGVLKDATQTKFRDINWDLYQAGKNFNETEAIKEFTVLVENGADIRAVFANGKRLIHVTAEAGNTKIAKKFLVKDTYIDVKDSKKRTALYIAARFGYEDFVQLLIENGADVNTQSCKGLTPLHVACDKGFISIVELLLKNYNINVNIKDKWGGTPLQAAIFGGLKIVQALISHKNIDINTKYEDDLTPFHISIILNYLDIVQSFIETGKIDINAKAKYFTPLHFVTIDGNIKMVEYLITQNGIDASAKSIDNFTALHFAIALKKEHRSEVVELVSGNNIFEIRKRNVSKSKIIDDIDNENPSTEIRNSQEIISILVRHGADIEAKTTDGKTPLHWAAENGKLNFVKYLIESGANIRAKDTNGNTPLHLAVQNCELDIIAYLIDKGANIKEENNSGCTPFKLVENL